MRQFLLRGLLRDKATRWSQSRERWELTKITLVWDTRCEFGLLQQEMSASSSPVDAGQDSHVDGSWRERERQMLRELEKEHHETGSVHDKSTDGGKNASQVNSTVVEKDDNDSVLSWVEDGVEVPFTQATPPVRSLGLSRRAGWTDYNDYE